MRRFLRRSIRTAQVKPRSIVVDKGKQFCCRGFKPWCLGRKIKPRFGAVGRRGSVALVERLISTLKEERIAGLIVPRRRREFQRALDSYAHWFNAHRPHVSLGGQTPNEANFRRKPASRRSRLEPRAKWPRGSLCAEPHVGVNGKCGEKIALYARFHAGR